MAWTRFSIAPTPYAHAFRLSSAILLGRRSTALARLKAPPATIYSHSARETSYIYLKSLCRRSGANAAPFFCAGTPHPALVQGSGGLSLTFLMLICFKNSGLWVVMTTYVNQILSRIQKGNHSALRKGGINQSTQPGIRCFTKHDLLLLVLAPHRS